MKNRAWLFMTPILILMSISAFLPLMVVVNYSQHYIFAGSTPYFVGLENFIEVLNDSAFQEALKKQLIFSFLVLVVEIPLGIIIAMCIPKKGRYVALILVLLGIPLLIPYNVVGIIWRLFCQSDIGIIDKILAVFNYSYNVSINSFDAAATIFLIDVWHWTPFVMLIALAGMSSVDNHLYESGSIDGASKLQMFWYVTLPLIRSTLFVAAILRFMDSMKSFDEIYIMTSGGPGIASRTLNLFIFDQAFRYFQVGYSSALVMIMIIIVMVISFIVLKLRRV